MCSDNVYAQVPKECCNIESSYTVRILPHIVDVECGRMDIAANAIGHTNFLCIA